MTSNTVYFVHISDTHIGPRTDFSQHGHYPLPCARRLVETINQLPYKPDFVIHTGDIVGEPDPSAYRLAAKCFERLEAPIYYVIGNHDTAADIRHFLPMGPHQNVGEDPGRLSYSFDFSGFRFLVLDARGPDEIDPHGLLPDSQIKLAGEEATSGDQPLTVFIHYPVLPMNSPWMDQNMLILNGEKLHEALKPSVHRLRGVFHGHIHQHMQSISDGIMYVGVASAFSQFGAWPEDIITHFDNEHDPGFSFVHLLANKTIIHQHTFPRPD